MSHISYIDGLSSVPFRELGTGMLSVCFIRTSGEVDSCRNHCIYSAYRLCLCLSTSLPTPFRISTVSAMLSVFCHKLRPVTVCILLRLLVTLASSWTPFMTFPCAEKSNVSREASANSRLLYYSFCDYPQFLELRDAGEGPGCL